MTWASYYGAWGMYIALWVLIAWVSYWLVIRLPRSFAKWVVSGRNQTAHPPLVPSFSALAAPGTTPMWPEKPQTPPVTDAAIRAEIQGLKVRIDRLHTMMERRS